MVPKYRPCLKWYDLYRELVQQPHSQPTSASPHLDAAWHACNPPKWQPHQASHNAKLVRLSRMSQSLEKALPDLDHYKYLMDLLILVWNEEREKTVPVVSMIIWSNLSLFSLTSLRSIITRSPLTVQQRQPLLTITMSSATDEWLATSEPSISTSPNFLKIK